MHQRTEIIGRLGRDPEARYTAQAEMVVNMSVAVSSWEGKESKTVWFTVVCWKDKAENAVKYLHKGDLIYAAGRLMSDDGGNPKAFTKKNGDPAAKFELTADKVLYLETKKNRAEIPEANLDTDYF